jgi:hypothetical protein
MSTRQLTEAILDGSIRSVNFFNGRLLSAEDLTEEQRARQQADERLGQAIGEGVAYGLEVNSTAGAGNSPVITIQPGLAINRKGHTLVLSVRTDIALVRPAAAGAAATPAAFRDCPRPQPGAYVVGEGLYLLVISPAAASEGRAPVSGLGNVSGSCNTRYKLDAVQFRLIPVTNVPTSVSSALLRSQVAYQCLGIADSLGFLLNPWASIPQRTSLLDALRMLRPGLTDCDVPLAMIYWTTAGIQFIDRWCVRRALTPSGASARWPVLMSGRRDSEAGAMFFQFQEQIEDILLTETNVDQLRVTDRFVFLPPAGMVPVRATGSPAGFNVQQFFTGIAPPAIATIDGILLRSLFAEAAQHEAINPASVGRVHLYLPFENLRAVETGLVNQLAVVFASPAMRSRGAARFSYGVLDSGRFAASVR